MLSFFIVSPFSAYLVPLLLLFSILLAIAFDRLFGEPARFHPLVMFGRWASFLERKCNTPQATRAHGAFALFITLSPLFLVAWSLFVLASWSLYAWLCVQCVILYICIGWQSLVQHASAIVEGVRASGVEEGRVRLSMIVSRETRFLTEEEIAQAGVESLLENSSDALFASLVWFVLGGAELALLHRWVNTLDAMWGYKNTRYKYFGWAAARLDDVMAYLPARIIAMSFVVCAGRRWKRVVVCWKRQAQHCASPNGGVVMVAGAAALGVRLSRYGWYNGKRVVKPKMGYGRPASLSTMEPAIQLVWNSILLFLICLGGLSLMIFFLFV